MAEWAQLITSIATLLAALGGIVVSLRNSNHIVQVAGRLAQVDSKVDAVHTATDGLTTQLVAVTRSDAKQAGVTEGRELEKTGQ